MPRAVLSWSSGKDSAFALHVARQTGVEVAALLTTVSEIHGRVSAHGVRREVVEAQAAAVGLPLVEVRLPVPCSNDVYDERMAAAVAKLRTEGVGEVVFGDVFLEDIRSYREERLSRIGMAARFPLWGRDTRNLAEAMLRAGAVAHVVSLDPAKLPRERIGARYDAGFLGSLPPGVDPCGEAGEFHTVVSDGPAFSRPVPLVKGDTVERDGVLYADFLLDGGAEG
jgi:uncharacterized protein (TIGR00290 family)